MIEIIPNWHPVFVHFTVTFLIITGVLQLMIWFFSKETDQNTLAQVRKWLVLIGSIIVIVTVATGLQAYNTVVHDSISHIAMTEHRNWALVTAAVFLTGAALFYILPGRRESIAGGFFIAAFLLVLVTGYKGGELVYRHGLGVMSLPEASGEGQDHHNNKHGISEPDQGHEHVR